MGMRHRLGITTVRLWGQPGMAFIDLDTREPMIVYVPDEDHHQLVAEMRRALSTGDLDRVGAEVERAAQLAASGQGVIFRDWPDPGA